MSELLKLTTFFGERDRTPDAFVADALLDLYERRGLRASVLLRGAEGFGASHSLRTDRLLTLSEDLPLVSVAVDEADRVQAALGDVLALKDRGLITVQAVQGPDGRPDGDVELTVWLARTDGSKTVCQVLHDAGVAGASVLLGVDGTLRGRRERARFFGRNRMVPAIVVAVGDARRIDGAVGDLRRLVPEALLTLGEVRVCRRDGNALADPHELPQADARGRSVWQALTIFASEQTRHDGEPLHSALVRRLRANGARGVTAVRGVWGYHGDHAPHGDRFLALQRRVPVITTVVDTPQGIAASWPVVAELTGEAGLVVSRMVPAMATLHPEADAPDLRRAAP